MVFLLATATVQRKSHCKYLSRKYSSSPRNRAFAGTTIGAIIVLILEPAGRNRYCTMAGEECVDRGQVLCGDGPAERAQIFFDFRRVTEADERGADDGIAGGPAECELRQRLVIFGRQGFELVDCLQVAREFVGPKERAEQIEAPDIALARAPVALFEPRVGAEGPSQHAIG